MLIQSVSTIRINPRKERHKREGDRYILFQDIALFEREAKTELITIRVTKSEKERISQMAGAKGISAFILSLVGQEHERQINQERKTCTAKVFDIFDDDGMPF